MSQCDVVDFILSSAKAVEILLDVPVFEADAAQTTLETEVRTQLQTRCQFLLDTEYSLPTLATVRTQGYVYVRHPPSMTLTAKILRM